MKIEAFTKFTSKIMKALPYICMFTLVASMATRGTRIATGIAIGFVGFCLPTLTCLVVQAIWTKLQKVKNEHSER